MATQNNEGHGALYKTLGDIAGHLKNYPFLLITVAGMGTFAGILIYDLEKLREFKWLLFAVVLVPVVIQFFLENKKIRLAERKPETPPGFDQANAPGQRVVYENRPRRMSLKAIASLVICAVMVVGYGETPMDELLDIELQVGLLVMALLGLGFAVSGWRDAARNKVGGKGLAITGSALSGLLVLSSLGWMGTSMEQYPISLESLAGAVPAELPPGSAQQQQLRDMSQDELAQRQQELQARIRQLESRLAGQQALAQPEKTLTTPDLTGIWENDEGIEYELHHDGSTLTIQERNPFFGVTTVGEGTVRGSDIQLNYSTVLGTTGRAMLRVGPDGDEISGAFTDLSTGVTLPITLYR